MMSSGFIAPEIMRFQIGHFDSDIARGMQGQLSRYEQGRSEIGAEVLLRLARRSGKTIEWLLTGKNSAL